MKKLLVSILAILLLSSISLAQIWTYDRDFSVGDRPHGVVVDDQDRLWIGYYGPADTLVIAPGDTIWIDGLRCLNPDGSHAPFSPIKIFTNGSTINDTLNWAGSYSCRGVALAADGNIIFNGSAGKIYKINKNTGEAMIKIITPTGGSPTKCAVDAAGFIYVTGVVPGGTPIYIYDSNLVLYSVVADSNFAISRAMEVSPDGNDVYLGVIYGGGGQNGIIHYQSDDGSGPDGTYSIIDTVWQNIWAGSCLDWDNNGLLWAGGYWDGTYEDWNDWYAIDLTQNYGIVDTVGHGSIGPFAAGVPGGSRYWSPRGAAWNAAGTVMFTADYDGGVVKKWTNASPLGPGSPVIWDLTVVSVEDGDKPIIAVDFSLNQNYPNPFNPETKIPFDIKKKFHVKLVVFDMLGRQVATLVDSDLAPKHYEFTFDGANFSSGTYFYQLIVDGMAQTKQMMLIK